jgi:glyoxylase-like metal-dependent hydrolase (beta-lactamase superfamily II)
MTTQLATAWICETCGVQFEPSVAPPQACPICEDERQYVGWRGQRWTTPRQLAEHRSIDFLREDDVLTLALTPSFAIGQRAFLIPHAGKHVLWECLSLVTDEAIARLRALGGVSCIALSHPHFHAAMIDWSEALGGVPVYVHEADRRWVQRGGPQLCYWSGERHALSDDLSLIRLPGHFEGSCGLWWRSGPRVGGSLFPGDALQVGMDRRHLTFMYSYPNAIPLGPAVVRRLRDIVAPLAFEDVFGFSRGRQIVGSAKAATSASFARYLRAIEEPRNGAHNPNASSTFPGVSATTP